KTNTRSDPMVSTARIILRDAAGPVTDEVERKLSPLERAWGNALVRKTVLILALAPDLGGLWAGAQQPAAVPDLVGHVAVAHRACRRRLPSGARLGFDKSAADGYVAGVLLAGALTILAIVG
ncbi:MAG TPA: hypothetical protein VFD73_06960, partial [Gemmatimonadales bacterium]|nr:hypothetical protein [Gemmatimonadales bacterium]